MLYPGSSVLAEKITEAMQQMQNASGGLFTYGAPAMGGGPVDLQYAPQLLGEPMVPPGNQAPQTHRVGVGVADR